MKRLALILSVSALTACATIPQVAQGDGVEPPAPPELRGALEATPAPPPPPPPAIAQPTRVERSSSARRTRAPSPLETLASANAAARQRPEAEGFVAARHVYAYEPGAIYQLYANPNFISSILLEPGETISAIAAGDTSRWMVTETQGESDADPRTIVLVKPQAANLSTNIVLVTDRRSYIIEASTVTGSNYSAQIAWSYPQTETASAGPYGVERLNFAYRIRTVRGRTPIWSPARVFDDGRRTWVEFDQRAEAADLPPIFVITGEGAELVNVRVQAHDGVQRYMIDRVFDRAELRLGVRAPIIVRIDRQAHARPQILGARP